jgi:Helix-turn-helix
VADQPHGESITVFPVMVLTRVFPARPSAVPEIREFVRQCLADAPLADVDNRELTRTVLDALLDAAGPTGAIEVSCRTYPDSVEFDVLHSSGAREEPVSPQLKQHAEVNASFAEWMTDVLRREGITREGAARQLGVSAKTVSRWVGGETEPRLRELRRIQELFGEVRLR